MKISIMKFEDMLMYVFDNDRGFLNHSTRQPLCLARSKIFDS